MDIPLAERLRPQSLDEFVGQEHLVGKGKPIRRMIENKKVISMVFWGPPGTGKTTLARIIAKFIEANFVPFSAVAGGGVAEVRKIIAEAKKIPENVLQEDEKLLMWYGNAVTRTGGAS